MTEKFPVAFGRTEWKINEDQHLAGGFMETSASYKKKINKKSEGVCEERHVNVIDWGSIKLQHVSS